RGCRPVRREGRTACCRAGPRPQTPTPGSREDQTCLTPPASESRPELEGQVEKIGEQENAEHRHDRGRDETLQHPHLLGTQNRDNKCHVTCDHHAHRPDHRREAEDRRDDQNRPANLVFLDAGSVGHETDQRDQSTKYDEKAGEQSRRSARTECKSPLTGKVPRRPNGKDRHRDQNQTTPEIPRTADRKTKAPPLWGRTDAFGHVPSRQPRTPCAEPPNPATPAFGSTFQWATGSKWGKITSQQPESDERGRSKNPQRIQ